MHLYRMLVVLSLLAAAGCQARPAAAPARNAPTAAKPSEAASAKAETTPALAKEAAPHEVAKAAPAAAPQADRDEAAPADAAWNAQKAYARAEGAAPAAQPDAPGAGADKRARGAGGAVARAAEPAPPAKAVVGDVATASEPKFKSDEKARDLADKTGAAQQQGLGTKGGEMRPAGSAHASRSEAGPALQIAAPVQGRSANLGKSAVGALFAPRHTDKVFRPLPPRPLFYPRDARYRANYLPGRGYLERLGAEVRKIPTQLAALALPDPAPRARSLPPPDKNSLRVAVDLSHKALPIEGGETIVRVRLRSTDQLPARRQPLRLHLVLDRSGSMKGEPWRQVCAAAKDLATRLTPEDRLSVVVYSDEARVLTSTLAGGPQLGAVANEICKMAPKGETNTLAGLALGYQQARAAYDPGSVNRVLLVSDGMPTIGPNDPYLLTIDTARALGEGITTSALGVGRDFDALLMDRVALEGGGNHHFVRDVAALPTVLTDELEVLSQQAAEAVDVRIRLADDVQLIEVIGSEPLSDAEALRVRQVEVAGDQRLQRDQGIAADRQKDREGGVRFLLPTFRAGDEHSFLLRVGVPPGNGRREVARVEVRYKDTIAGRNAAYAGGRGIEQGVPRETAEAQADQEVLLAEVEARAADTLQRASEYLDLANLPEIRQELYRAAVAVQRAADRSGSAVAHVDSDRLRQLADALTTAMQSGQRAWMVSAFHYYWRTCGVTAWQG